MHENFASIIFLHVFPLFIVIRNISSAFNLHEVRIAYWYVDKFKQINQEKDQKNQPKVVFVAFSFEIETAYNVHFPPRKKAKPVC